MKIGTQLFDDVGCNVFIFKISPKSDEFSYLCIDCGMYDIETLEKLLNTPLCDDFFCEG